MEKGLIALVAKAERAPRNAAPGSLGHSISLINPPGFFLIHHLFRDSRHDPEV
jgi:hypothetical protein